MDKKGEEKVAKVVEAETLMQQTGEAEEEE